MIIFILFVASTILHGQTIIGEETKSCDICIIDSMCGDDAITFNISISDYCQKPLNVYFRYHTDVNPKARYYNTTTTCINCYTNILLDVVRDAWDYTLTLELPKPSKTCPTQHTAHCGGIMSQLIWYITGGLSGLFIVLGVILCCIKSCRKPKKPVKVKKKKADVSVINA